jgi:hypothetical protein
MPSKTLAAATGNYDLGDVSPGAAGFKVVNINLGSGPLVGSFAVQGRLGGSSGTFVPIPYKRRVLNGVASDDTIVSAAITTNAIIEINATGLEVRLVWTYTSGAATASAVSWADVMA